MGEMDARLDRQDCQNLDVHILDGQSNYVSVKMFEGNLRKATSVSTLKGHNK